MTCDQCGVELQIGDWPICHGNPLAHARSVAAVHQDSVEGGFWAENGFDRPTYFESKKAHRDALAAKGLEIRAKYAGPHDKILTNWAAGIDAVTLQNAAALLSRGTKKTERERDPREEFPITVTDGETFTYRLDG